MHFMQSKHTRKRDDAHRNAAPTPWSILAGVTSTGCLWNCSLSSAILNANVSSFVDLNVASVPVTRWDWIVWFLTLVLSSDWSSPIEIDWRYGDPVFYNHIQNRCSVQQEYQRFAVNHCSNTPSVSVEWPKDASNECDILVISLVDMLTKWKKCKWSKKTDEHRSLPRIDLHCRAALRGRDHPHIWLPLFCRSWLYNLSRKQ